MLSTFNLKKWIDEHRHLLKPPVGNAQIWKDAEFMVTIVGGPNARKDYHIDPGEEFFYQIEGDMVLKIVENGVHKDIEIKEGEIFLLPAFVPHSPRRFENTVGMVIERQRRPDEKDGLRWYCENCGEMLYETYFHLTDITTQLQPVFEQFYGNPELCTCKKCGTKMERPVKSSR
ncbi:MAG: 3-hydroxyanthranilate 3,4-dioxygenase [Bacteroidia bacterium]|nr:3-hydroxyanthranilate 3,4-dioxygenase [Bacteroidia bacterium]MDW8302096.1 3-hydroxyanthranilate 3,4-dioxygenase [Bacteroidia bacterium]